MIPTVVYVVGQEEQPLVKLGLPMIPPIGLRMIIKRETWHVTDVTLIVDPIGVLTFNQLVVWVRPV